MSHTTEVIGYRKISNGQFAIDITCCGVHKHTHTVIAEAVSTPDKRDSSIEFARNLAAQNHEQAQQAEKHLLEAVGSTKEHS